MRVAFDVAPLSHPRTGVGNYVLGSLRGLVEAGADVVPFAPTSAPGRRAIREALARLPEPQLRVLPFAHFWRQARNIVAPSGQNFTDEWIYTLLCHSEL